MGLEDDMAELPLEGVGARLRNARESMGKTRADFAATTKIPERMLAALEDGNYAALPARTYATGFARSYARALGLDAEAVVRQVRSEIDGTPAFVDRPAPASFEPGDPARVPSPRLAWIAAGLVVLLLVTVGAWRMLAQPGGELPSILPTATPVPVATAAAPKPAVSAAPSGPVVITAESADVWLHITDGSKDLLQRNLVRGESYTIPADAADPRLRTGRPDALAITIGGQPVPRIADKQALVSNVPLTAAALLARAVPPPPAPAATPSPGASSSPSVAASTAPAVPHTAPRPRPHVPHPAPSAAPTPAATPTAAPSAANPSTATQ
ncbi:MAG: DUF4115 domain-containing protein [Sphingomonadales bacterium]|nr:DUF4115 domain-containing protein [Sphingomonadales bacterium]